MNILGLTVNIAKTKTLQAQAAAAAEAVDDDPDTPESVKFGRLYQRRSAKEMLTTLDHNRRDAETITKIALYLSIPHQVGYLLSKVTLEFSTWHMWLVSITALGLAVGGPYLNDRVILMCVRNIAARASSNWSKAKSFVVLVPTTAASGYVNFAAPGAPVIKWVAVGVVVMIVLSQVVRSCTPDFRRGLAEEQRIASELEVPAKPTPTGPRNTWVVTPEEKAWRKARGYDRKDPAGKAALTAKYRQMVREQQAKAEQLAASGATA